MSFKVQDCPVHPNSAWGVFYSYDMDDWNRTRNERSRCECGCALLEHRHIEEYDGEFYAVPNGYTLHPETVYDLVMPKYETVEESNIYPEKINFPKPTNFVERLCQCVDKARLTELKCLLADKRVKFERTQKGKLCGLFYEYKRWFDVSNIDESRIQCLLQVNKAIDYYYLYAYNKEQLDRLDAEEYTRVAKVNETEKIRVTKLNAEARTSALAKLNWTEDDVVDYYESLRLESLWKSELLPCRKELEKYCY